MLIVLCHKGTKKTFFLFYLVAVFYLINNFSMLVVELVGCTHLLIDINRCNS